MLHDYLFSLIQSEHHRIIDHVVLGILSVLEMVYRLLVWTRNHLYDCSIFPNRHLGVPVISLGNIALGGTGKTPLTIYLAQYLSESGWRPGILLRGYRGEGKGVRLVSDGKRIHCTLEDSGDEAQLLARALPNIPVIAGSDRFRAGKIGEKQGVNAIILDDGFQYRSLHRDLDIILLDPARPWENGHLIPRGLLRESKASLKRGHLVVLSGNKHLSEETKSELEREVRCINPNIPVVYAGIKPIFVKPLRTWWDGKDEYYEPRDYLAGKSVGALSAIGRPEKFITTLEEIGTSVSDRIIRPDHFAWCREDLQAILCSKIHIWVTTEKDAVKLGFLIDEPLICDRIVVLGIRPALSQKDEEILMGVLDTMLSANESIPFCSQTMKEGL
jgi:tetraacyldisaccharide 4'-kinase